MIAFDALKTRWQSLQEPLSQVRDSLDLPTKKARISELEEQTVRPDFWDDSQRSQKVIAELNGLRSQVESYEKLKAMSDDIEVLIDMGLEEEDESVVPEIEDLLEKLEKGREEVWMSTLLSGPYDKESAILTLHAGAGGTESCDWTQMLYRMYTRWGESKGYKVTELDFLDGDEAGLKTVTFEIDGPNAYGYLKSEQGIHRLVRISPFNAAGKRQTSFSSLEVLPTIEEDIDLDIPDDDLKIDVYRSSGAGGQHVNKTSSAIRITHLPTGIVVQCQNERSQHMNKAKAMQILKSKLLIIKQQEQADKISDIRGEIMENGFGSQIRSYVLHPYTMVKDHRTGVEIGNAQRVLDGDLDPFMHGYLIAQARGSSDDE